MSNLSVPIKDLTKQGGATEVDARATSMHGGTAITILYTVTAGKTLFIEFINMIQRQSTAAPGIAELVQYAADGTTYEKTLMFAAEGFGQDKGNAWNYSPRIMEIPAGKKVGLRKRTYADADTTNEDAFAAFTGYEV